MSLIKCAECNGAVSTKASVCPHCGCPLEAESSCLCTIQGNSYDLSEVLALAMGGNTPENRVKGCRLIQSITGMEIWNAKGLWDEIVTTHQVPSAFLELEEKRAQNKPRCPLCNSALVEPIGLGARATATVLFGVVSNTARKQMMCKNCGYKF